MTRPHASRRVLLVSAAGGAVGIALAAGAMAPWQSRNAEAQVDPSQPGTETAPEFDDPALAGTDSVLTAPDSLSIAPATPVVTPEASVPSPTWEPTESGMSTSLGGSDI